MPACVCGVVVYACTGTWGRGILLRCRCVCGLLSCSLKHNVIGAAGAAAIGAGLVHLSQLQTLKYVVCPTVSTGP